MDSGPVAPCRAMRAAARASGPLASRRAVRAAARACRPAFGLHWLNEDWRASPARDAITAVILTIVTVYASYGEAHPVVASNYFSGSHHLPYTPNAALALPAASGLLLAWRHRYPRLVVCASAAAVVAYTLPGWVNGAVVLMPAVALGTLAAMVPARSALAWAVGLLAVLTVASVLNNPLGPLGGGVVVLPATLTVALLAGIAIRNRRAYAGSVRLQAERDMQRQADEERLRIARELHDVVAHTMATITVQAAAASQLLATSPERAAESLAAIRAASKEGLRELHAILNVLRHDGDPPDPTAPAGGLARLDALVEGVRRAGVPVTVTIEGQPRPLPAVTDLSAFRIIQEALTNTVRHAGPAKATVAVRYGPGDLRIEVTDDGRIGPARGVAERAATGPAPAAVPVPPAGRSADPGLSSAQAAGPGLLGVRSSGHGLRGMRERAAVAGGTIQIGPAPSGGFRVVAWFPGQPDASQVPMPAQEPPATQETGGDQ